MISIFLNLRVVLKNKLGYAICLFSLITGFSVCLLVFRFYQAENAYDTNHPGSSNIYRTTIFMQLNGAEYGEAVVQFPVAHQLQTQYPGIESTSRIFRGSGFPLIRFETRKFVEEKQLFVDSNFLSFFAFPLIKGDYHTALRQPNNVVLTQAAILKYFGDEDPMGKTLILDEEHTLVVTGVIDETKIRSHIDFDVLIPLSFQFDLWRASGASAQTEESWLATLPWTYIKFKNQAGKVLVESQLNSFVQKYFPDAIKSNNCRLQLQPITEIHTSSHFDSEIEPNTSDTYLKIFAYIIGAILLFSTINFINLNTSILLNRGKEFSMKVILGSSKSKLFGEIFISTLLIAGISLILSICLVILFQRYFNILMDVQLLPISLTEDWKLLLSSFGFIVLISLIGSLQPFFVMISRSPLETIKDTGGITSLVRKLSIGLQVACSFILVFGTLVIFKQTGFLMTSSLGFNKENIVVLPARQSIIDHYEAFKNEIKKITSVENMTWTSDTPGMGGISSYRFVPEGYSVDKPAIIPFVQVDYDFIETMGIKMKEGREFHASLPGDVGQTYIVNQALLNNLGWKDEGLGKKLQMFKPGEKVIGYSGTIVGVFDDFHTESLHFPVKPLVIALRHLSRDPGSFVIKTKGVDAKTLKQIEQVWKNFENEWPFEYKLLNHELDKQYNSESKLFVLTMILSMLAILISFFGLFGTNSIAIWKKYKTVAIKKVLGAHTGIIFKEVVGAEFVFLALVFLVAAPCSYLVAAHWLNEFEYRITISYSEFFETIILISLLVFVTLLYHLVMMIRTNPLKHIARD